MLSVLRVGAELGKEPSFCAKTCADSSPSVMYAMLREAFHLVESGVASIADVDRSLRNDLGIGSLLPDHSASWT